MGEDICESLIYGMEEDTCDTVHFVSGNTCDGHHYYGNGHHYRVGKLFQMVWKKDKTLGVQFIDHFRVIIVHGLYLKSIKIK